MFGCVAIDFPVDCVLERLAALFVFEMQGALAVAGEVREVGHGAVGLDLNGADHLESGLFESERESAGASAQIDGDGVCGRGAFDGVPGEDESVGAGVGPVGIWNGVHGVGLGCDGGYLSGSLRRGVTETAIFRFTMSMWASRLVGTHSRIWVSTSCAMVVAWARCSSSRSVRARRRHLMKRVLFCESLLAQGS